MSVEHLNSCRAEIEAFLRRSPELHIYSLGDLDDFFWPYTTWYGWQEDGEIEDIAMIYVSRTLPTVVGISQQPAVMRKLLAEITPLLPEMFYAHLSPGAERAFSKTHVLESHGPHYKMALRDAACARAVDCPDAAQLTLHDAPDLIRLYQESYPGNWFDLRVLETGQYFGVRQDDRLVSVAGVHVYSERYGVAALGNIVTHPAYRRQGYARQATARLCQSVLQKVEHVGLNVKADNDAAIGCYSGLGFEIIAPYAEFTITERA
jgi:ribosomal protein S18 acetylase RimI-like enzyme